MAKKMPAPLKQLDSQQGPQLAGTELLPTMQLRIIQASQDGLSWHAL
jgi:hypothetical protein